MLELPPIPAEIKHIAHFLKVADEHDERNIVVSYWSRMYACQVAMKSVPGKKPPEVTAVLLAIMDWLEKVKKSNLGVEGLHNETCAHALVEQYVLQLFSYADAQDKAENFGKNVVKAFYTSGILMDVLQQFGNLSEDIYNKRKYAKWKAAYIHNCLKNGEKPLPGPPVDRNLLGDSDDDDDEEGGTNVPQQPITPQPPPASNRIQSPTQPPITPDPFNLPSVPSEPDPYELPLPIAPQVIQPQPTFPVAPQPAPRNSPSNPITQTAAVGPEQVEKAQKYCKFAASALNYDDISAAIDNLQKALNLLQYGVEK